MVAKSARVCFMIAFACWIALFIAIGPLLYWLFPQYIDAVPLVVLFALISVINSIAITNMFFRTHNKMREVVSITVLYSLCLFATALLAIPVLGVYGVVLAEFASCVYQFWLYTKLLDKNNFLFSIIPTREDLADVFGFMRFLLNKRPGKKIGRT